MATQSITLKIAGKSYAFNIEQEKEERYRLAEREVNSYLAAYKRNNVRGWTEQDYLAIVALQLAIVNVEIRQNSEPGDEDLRRLETLAGEIDDYLNRL